MNFVTVTCSHCGTRKVVPEFYGTSSFNLIAKEISFLWVGMNFAVI